MQRLRHGVCLTPAGERFARHASQGVAALEDALLSVSETDAGPVRLGVLPTLAVELVHDILMAWRGRGMQGAVQVATGRNHELLTQLQRGELDAVMSNDMDLLARGVHTLLVPERMSVPGDTSGWISYELSDILHHAGLTYLQFLEMCVLMGSDYTNKAKSLPFKQSYFTIKYKGNLHKALESIHIKDFFPYDRAIDMLNGRNETADDLMSEKQWLKWSLWLKGNTDAITTETPYLETLRKEQLKDMNADEFQLLFQSDILVL